MDELTKIVLDMNQDIKQIREAQSLEGARNWVQKHGPNIYDAVQEDVNEDGIPDIIVRNKQGKNVIVNGYTTDKSTYPYRYGYYTLYPTQEARKQAREDGMTFREYINSMYRPQYHEDGIRLQRDQAGNPIWGSEDGITAERKMKNSGYDKIIRPNDRSIYQAFTKFVLKPIYDVVKFLNKKYNIQTNPMLLNKVASTIWNQAVLLPVMAHVYPNLDVSKLTDKEWKKLRNRKEVKKGIASVAVFYIRSPKAMIDFIPMFVKCCEVYGNPIDPKIKPYIPLILKARLLQKDPPADLNDNEAWAEIDREFQARFLDPLQQQPEQPEQ